MEEEDIGAFIQELNPTFLGAYLEMASNFRSLFTMGENIAYEDIREVFCCCYFDYFLFYFYYFSFFFFFILILFYFEFYYFFLFYFYFQAEVALENRSRTLFNTFLYLIRSRISGSQLLFLLFTSLYISFT